jgi:hypothetical protein
MRSRTICAAAALVASLTSVNAYADAECDKGVRETTPAEQAAMKNVLDGIDRALPPAPQGWVIQDEGEPSIATEICRDVEQKPWAYSRSRFYRETAGDEQRQAAVTAAGQRAQANLASKQPRIDAVTAKITALVPKVEEAAQKGDLARLTALGEESDKLKAEYDRIVEEGGDPRQELDATTQNAYADTTMSISVYVNPSSDGLPSDAARIAPPRGASTAARRGSGGVPSAMATEVVAFGTWHPTPEGFAEPVRRAGPPHAPHGISVQINAADERLDQVVSSIDFGAIGKLLAP